MTPCPVLGTPEQPMHVGELMVYEDHISTADIIGKLAFRRLCRR
jgi:hypothetical protein